MTIWRNWKVYFSLFPDILKADDNFQMVQADIMLDL